MEGDVLVPLGVGVDPVVFRAISCLDVTTILGCRDEMLRPILACLVSSVISIPITLFHAYYKVRMSLIAPLDQSPACLEGRTSVLQVSHRHVNFQSQKLQIPGAVKD